MPLFSTDRWFAPVTITTGVNDVIEAREVLPGPVVSNFTVTIPAGTYYCFADPAPAGYFSLYAELATQFTAGSPNGAVYTVAHADPTISTFAKLSSVSLTATGGGLLFFSYLFSVGTFNFDSVLLGFKLAETVDKTSTGPVGLQVLAGEYTCSGIWTSPSGAIRKDRRPVNIQARSKGLEDSTVENRWFTKSIRHQRYEYVPAAHVKPNRCEYLDYVASSEGLAQFDAGNAFQDIWSDGLSKYVDVFVQQEGGATAADVTDPYDVVRVWGAKNAADDFNNVVSIQRMAGEYYSIDLLLYRKTSSTYTF